MKKIYTIIVTVAIFTFQSLFANTDNNPTVKEQLENLNKCWKDKSFDDQILKERILLIGDVRLIQMHLSLVEQKLREDNSNNWSKDQKVNRLKCLDILHNYSIKGTFPQNLYHNKRTPYFIDNFGTACAVGQLIISTGYEDLAKTISTENNYSYIDELNVKYPELKQWADKFGFTVNELAWIQPGYEAQNCDTTCNITASISASNGNPPYNYIWSNGQTTMVATDLCPGTSYTCTVTDALGNVVPSDSCSTWSGFLGWGGTNIVNLPASTPFYISLSSTDDNESCNGTATVTVTIGDPTYSYSYYWYPSGQTTATATGLCQGQHILSVYASIDLWTYCSRVDSIMVNGPAGIDEPINNNSNILVFPNPFSLQATLEAENVFKDATLAIYNSFGQQVKQINNISGKTITLQRDNLPAGLYFIRLIQDNKTFTTDKLIITDN